MFSQFSILGLYYLLFYIMHFIKKSKPRENSLLGRTTVNRMSRKDEDKWVAPPNNKWSPGGDEWAYIMRQDQQVWDELMKRFGCGPPPYQGGVCEGKCRGGGGGGGRNSGCSTISVAGGRNCPFLNNTISQSTQKKSQQMDGASYWRGERVSEWCGPCII